MRQPCKFRRKHQPAARRAQGEGRQPPRPCSSSQTHRRSCCLSRQAGAGGWLLLLPGLGSSTALPPGQPWLARHSLSRTHRPAELKRDSLSHSNSEISFITNCSGQAGVEAGRCLTCSRAALPAQLPVFHDVLLIDLGGAPGPHLCLVAPGLLAFVVLASLQAIRRALVVGLAPVHKGEDTVVLVVMVVFVMTVAVFGSFTFCNNRIHSVLALG